jgi:hypothetical protein
VKKFLKPFLQSFLHYPKVIQTIHFMLGIIIIAFPANCFSAQDTLYQQIPEYQVKAGLIYKFLEFVDWPDEAFQNSDQEIIIGIIGKNPFGDAFKAVEGIPVKGRKLVIKQVSVDSPLDELRGFQLLYISPSLSSKSHEIISALGTSPALTVSESSEFIDNGGMINFVIRDGKVRFEINNAAAERTGIKFRSKLLRVSIRVIMDNHTQLIN